MMALEEGKLKELLSGERIKVKFEKASGQNFEVHIKLLGHFSPFLSELFDVVDLKKIELHHATKEGGEWLCKWMEAGGKDETGLKPDSDPDTADSGFVDVLLSRIVAAKDLGIDQLKDEMLSTLYSMLDRNPFTIKQLEWIDEHTDDDFGDDLRRAATTSITKSLLDSPDSYTREKWLRFGRRFNKQMRCTLNSMEIIHYVKNSQRSEPLPLYKLRFLYQSMPRYCHLGPVIAASLWQLIHDGKVSNVKIYHQFALESIDFRKDMERVFVCHQAHDCRDTGAMQKTWNENVNALELEVICSYGVGKDWW